MVKKIRRRVNKAAEEAEKEALNLPETDESEEGFVADLERFAEDSFTRSLVNGLKVIHRYRKALVILVIVGLGFFAFNQLNTLTEQEDLGSASQTLDKALNALEDAQGPDPLQQARGDDSQKVLTADEVNAKLSVAAKAFGQLDDAALVGKGGQASAFFALGDHGKAIEHYQAASEASEKDVLMLAVALNGQAAALEDSGKPNEAIKVWKRLATLDKEKYGTIAALEQARLLMAANRAQEARALIDGVETAKLSPFGLKPQVEQLQGLLPRSTK